MKRWLGFVCDSSSAMVVALRESGADVAAIDSTVLEWDAGGPGPIAQSDLVNFVRRHRLSGAEARVLVAGAGTVLQKLRLPPMKPRHRLAAVRTRLTSYAGGRPLLIALRTDPGTAETDGAASTLAAGVDSVLVRGLLRVCQTAGLRVPSVTAVATAFAAPDSHDGIQLVVAERTTTVQVFAGGRLLSCRDVLIGRRDFVAAYLRPILTDEGAITLPHETASLLFAKFGVPTDPVAEIAPGVKAAQLWPLLNPVLQRVRQEVTQTLSQSGLPSGEETTVNTLSWPPLPGLTDYLAGELRLRPAHATTGASEQQFLRTLRAGRGTEDEVDLRPPEERFVARVWRPAVAAGVAALFVLAANISAPRQARAAVQMLAPVSQRLSVELDDAHAQRAALELRVAEAARRLGRDAALRRALPPDWPVVPILKTTLAKTPPEVALDRVELRMRADRIEGQLRGRYQGSTPAGVVARKWVRQIAGIHPYIAADVFGVGGSGREESVPIDLRVNVVDSFTDRSGTKPDRQLDN